jgi:rRNA maturation endonuclease Nob1
MDEATVWNDGDIDFAWLCWNCGDWFAFPNFDFDLDSQTCPSCGSPDIEELEENDNVPF